MNFVPFGTPYCLVCNCAAIALPSVDSADLKFLTGTDQEELRRSSALFILKMKEQRRTSQVVINDIVEGSRSLFCLTFDRLQAGVKSQLAEVGVDPESVGLEKVFKDIVDPFQGLETCHLQEKYFREELHLVVSTRSQEVGRVLVAKYVSLPMRMHIKILTYDSYNIISEIWIESSREWARCAHQ